MEAMLAEKHGVKKGLLGDINGGLVSAYVEMKHSYRVGFIVSVASAAEDLDVTLVQAQDAAGTGKKALPVESKYFVKAGADTSFTKKDLLNVAQIQDADFNGAEGLLIVDVLAENLDIENGFSHVAVEFAAAVARVASVEIVCHEMKKGAAYKEAL